MAKKSTTKSKAAAGDKDKKTAPKKAAKKTAAKKSAAKKTAATKKASTPRKSVKKSGSPKKNAKSSLKKTAAKSTTSKKNAAKKAGKRNPVTTAVLAARDQTNTRAVEETPVSGELEPSARQISNPTPINGMAWNRPDRAAKRFIPQRGIDAKGGDLPNGYNRTRLSVLVRDTEWIFAFWEIAVSTVAEFGLGGHNPPPLVLRLADVTGIDYNGSNAHSIEDIRVGNSANSWYINVPVKGRSYLVELGVQTDDGKFTVIAQSHGFEMPRAEVSNHIDWHLDEKNEEEHLQILQMSGGTKMPARLSSADFVSQLQNRLVEESGVSSGTLAGAGELSSGFARTQAPADRRFWLVVDAEVIVYGATEPNAQVRFMGRDIKLNPDGTFGIRVALPDGQIEFPVSATSGDGEEVVEVCPVVTRITQR